MKLFFSFLCENMRQEVKQCPMFFYEIKIDLKTPLFVENSYPPTAPQHMCTLNRSETTFYSHWTCFVAAPKYKPSLI